MYDASNSVSSGNNHHKANFPTEGISHLIVVVKAGNDLTFTQRGFHTLLWESMEALT